MAAHSCNREVVNNGARSPESFGTRRLEHDIWMELFPVRSQAAIPGTREAVASINARPAPSLRVLVVQDESLLAGSLRTWNFSTNVI
jgi:hypothetical protein